MTEVGDIPDEVVTAYKTAFNAHIRNVLNSDAPFPSHESLTNEASRAGLAAAYPSLLAEMGRLKKERDYAVRWANRSVDSVKEECFAEVARLREALKPSAETKAAYIGEFKFSIEDRDEDGEECQRSVIVPWTTVKEIMAAILARAALSHPEDKL